MCIFKGSDDEAPTPPQRVESLSPSKRRGQPPPPPPRSFPVDDDTSTTEPASKLPKLEEFDNTDVPQKPPRAHVFETNSDHSSVSDTTGIVNTTTELTNDQIDTSKHSDSKSTTEYDSNNQVELRGDTVTKSNENQSVGSSSGSQVEQQEADTVSTQETSNSESHEHVGNSEDVR